MDPQNSYDAKVRALARAKAKQEHSFFLSLYAKLVTDEAIYDWKKEKLQLQIDEALLQGDREAFYSLTDEYNQLIR